MRTNVDHRSRNQVPETHQDAVGTGDKKQDHPEFGASRHLKLGVSFCRRHGTDRRTDQQEADHDPHEIFDQVEEQFHVKPLCYRAGLLALQVSKFHCSKFLVYGCSCWRSGFETSETLKL